MRLTKQTNFMVWLIYNHNRYAVSKRLLLQIKKRKWPGSLVVLDDACAPDQHLKLWLRHYPLPYLYLSSDEYLGKAAGYDRMVRTALIHDKQLMVITDEAVDVSKNFIDEANKLWHLRPKRVGGGTVWFGKCRYLGGGNADDWQITPIRGETRFDAKWLVPACLMFTVQAYTKAGPFTRGYYQGMWSVDWCDRVRNAGYEIQILPVHVMLEDTSELFDVVGAGNSYFSGRNGWLYWHYRKRLFESKLRGGLGTMRQWKRFLTERSFRQGCRDGWRLRGSGSDVRMDG